MTATWECKLNPPEPTTALLMFTRCKASCTQEYVVSRVAQPMEGVSSPGWILPLLQWRRGLYRR